MGQEAQALPEGWVEVPLRDIAEHQKGKIPKSFSEKPQVGFLPYIDIKAFEKGTVDRYATIEKTTITSPDDVLVVWDGARFGLSGMGTEGVLGSTLVRINSPAVETKYLYYFIHSHYRYINSRPRGTGTPHVEPDIFWPLPLPIAPLNEQRRIVDKIEALFSDLDKGEENLRHTQRLLKRYRQSVLKAAVTGELLPLSAYNQWKQYTVGELLTDIRYGTAKKCDHDNTLTPVLRIPNVVSGNIDLTDLKYTEFTEKELSKLGSVDILFQP